MPPLPNPLFLLQTAISSQNLQEERRRLKQRAVLSPAMSLRRLRSSASAAGPGRRQAHLHAFRRKARPRPDPSKKCDKTREKLRWVFLAPRAVFTDGKTAYSREFESNYACDTPQDPIEALKMKMKRRSPLCLARIPTSSTFPRPAPPWISSRWRPLPRLMYPVHIKYYITDDT